MGPQETACAACGYVIPGAGTRDAAPPPPRPDSVDEELPPDEPPRARPAEGKSSGIKVRRDGAPLRRADRAADEAHEHNPDRAMSAEGASIPHLTLPPGGLGPAPPAPSGVHGRGPMAAHGALAGPSGAVPHRRPSVALAPASSLKANMALGAALLGCIPLFPPVAILLGILALREIGKAQSFMAGSGRAIFSIVVGALGSVFWIAAAVVVARADVSGLFRQGKLAMNMMALEMIAERQETFRATVRADADGDGKGEYGTAEELTAAFEDLDLTEFQNGALGWTLRVELPRTTNGREQTWWAFLEPAGDPTGKPWLYIDDSRILRRGDDIAGTPTRRQAQRWPATSSDIVIEETVGTP